MLWIFLVSFNILFILILWDYFKCHFYFFFINQEKSLFLLTFVNLNLYYYCTTLKVLTYLKLFFIKYYKFLLLNQPQLILGGVHSWLQINLGLHVINIYTFYTIICQIYIFIFEFFNTLASYNTTYAIYNWDGIFNHYNAVNSNTNFNFLTTIQHLFIMLTVFLTPLALFSNWNDLKYKFYNIKSFLLILLTLILLLIISFSTFNLFLFIVMFEATTLPLFLLISLFGHRSKKYRAAWYLFIYTLLGSIFMLGAVILIYYQYKTVNLFEIFINYQFLTISPERFKLIWLGLFLGFAIKVPIAPFHMWLPEAHVEAPTAGSILLAGILLKLGGYGMIFFMLPFFNHTMFLPLVYTLTGISMVYSSFILFRETHLKKIIAYSSIVHMNIGILGLFTNNVIGIMGGVFMMFSHGFISAGLFYCGGIIFNRFKSYDITTIKNLSTSMPKFSFFVIILIFGNMGLPLTSGFIGEFFVLVGLIKHNYFLTLVVLLVLLLNTIYNIILLTRILYGNLLLPSFLSSIKTSNFKSLYKPKWQLITTNQDITRLEFFSLSILSFYSIFFGIWPNLFLNSFTNDYYLTFI